MKLASATLRGVTVAAAVGASAFFAWWAGVIWSNIWDRSADNEGYVYFALGALPAALCALFLGLALASARWEKRRFAILAVPTLILLAVATSAGFFGQRGLRWIR